MMMWTMYEPKTSKRRKASMGIKTENPLDHIKACVSQCRAQGMIQLFPDRGRNRRQRLLELITAHTSPCCGV